MSSNEIQVISFYRFQNLEKSDVERLSQSIKELEKQFDLRGLFILGTEGLNCTFSVRVDQAEDVKIKISELLGFELAAAKVSFTSTHPFHELKIRERDEIVTIGRPDLQPSGEQHHHLTPKEWQQSMNESDTVVIDTRNSYEYDIGHFRGALNPDTREFTQFPKWLEKTGLPKNKKILIYCTGGIRCEKAILEMEEQGYRNVYQLSGGILNYLREQPHQAFEGECFVFDYRVAVDQNLAPTKTYKLCPHCGQPAKEKVSCIHCGDETVVCAKCLESHEDHRTCSKNCAHHFRMGHRCHKPGTKRRTNVSVDSHSIDS